MHDPVKIMWWYQSIWGILRLLHWCDLCDFLCSLSLQTALLYLNRLFNLDPFCSQVSGVEDAQVVPRMAVARTYISPFITSPPLTGVDGQVCCHLLSLLPSPFLAQAASGMVTIHVTDIRFPNFTPFSGWDKWLIDNLTCSYCVQVQEPIEDCLTLIFWLMNESQTYLHMQVE